MSPLSLQATLKNMHWLMILAMIFFLCTVKNTVAEIRQSFTLPLTYEYESNPNFAVTGEQSINRVVLVPAYSLLINQTSEEWLANASLRVESSSDQMISQDRNDPSLTLGWRHNYETGQFGITSLLNDQSTRVTEFTTSGQQVSGDNTQKNRSVSVNWLNNLSDRTSLTLNGMATNVTFEGVDITELVNYRNESSNVRLSYTLNEKTETFTQISYSRFIPENTNSLHSDTIGFNLGLTYNLNEKFNMTISAGTYETTSESEIQSAITEKSTQAMLDMQYSTLRTNSQLSLSRHQSPGSVGMLNEIEQVVANWRYNLTDRDNIAFNFDWLQNLTQGNRQRKSITANYTKELSLSWGFNLSAMHRNLDDNLTNISSNSVMASIIYNITDF